MKAVKHNNDQYKIILAKTSSVVGGNAFPRFFHWGNALLHCGWMLPAMFQLWWY